MYRLSAKATMAAVFGGLFWICCTQAWADADATQAPASQAEATPAPAQNPVLVRIGTQDNITAADVRAYAIRRADLRALLNTTEGQKRLLDEIAMTRVLVLEGDRLGEPRLADPPPGVDPRFDDIYALAVYRKLAGECPTLSDESQARQYFDTHPQAFRVPPQARLTRIVLPKAATIDKFGAEAWLGLQGRAVAMGAASFDALVKRAREAAPDLRQGDLGWVAIDDASEAPLLGAIQQAGKGGMVGPLVEGDYVYLIQVTDWREVQQLPWEAVKHQVPTRAVQYCREEQRKRVQRELYQRYAVQVHAELLRDAGAGTP